MKKATDQSRQPDKIRISVGLSAVILSLVLILTGCIPDNFSWKEKMAFLEVAGDMVLDYLDEHYSGAKIDDIQPETDVAPDGSGYELTEFASGQFSWQGQTYDFCVNTESGQVYTSIYLEEISEELKEALLRSLSIDASETAIVRSDITYLPVKNSEGYIAEAFRNVFPHRNSAEELLQEILQDTEEYRVILYIQYKGGELPREITEQDAPFPALSAARFYRVAGENELCRNEYSILYLPILSEEILWINYSQSPPENYSYIRNQVMEQDGFYVVYNAYERTMEDSIVTESTVAEEDITLTVTEDYIALDCINDNYVMYLFTMEKKNAEKYLYTFDKDVNHRAEMKECRWKAYEDRYIYSGTLGVLHEFSAGYSVENIIYTKAASEEPPILPQVTGYKYIY